MSQTISPAGFDGSVPADLNCGFCKRPVQGVFYRALNRFACANCASQVQGAIDRNVVTPGAFAQAGALGLLVGLGCAAAWAVIVHVTNYEIGIIASFIGVAVGKVVYFASGKRRGIALQWLAAILSVVVIAGGKLMVFSWAVLDYLNQQGTAATPLDAARATMLVAMHEPTAVFRPFDLLWMAIAVYAAVRICKAPRITIAGPFAADPSADAGLQFHTIEPAAIPPVATQPPSPAAGQP